MKLEKDIVVLLVIFGVLMWIGSAAAWGNTLKHDFPYALSASDAFQHQARAESIKDMGGYNYEASHIVNGYTDVVGYYPPVLYHLGALLSFASGLETYDTTFFLVFLMAVLAAMIMYILIKTVSVQIAILSIPLFLFLFFPPLTTTYLWGQWPSAATHVFLIAAVLTLVWKGRYWWLLFGIFTSASMLTHTSEIIFLGGFMGMYGVLTLYRRNLQDIKELALAGAATLMVSGYYLIIFRGTWIAAHASSYKLFTVEHASQGFPTVMPTDFGWALAIMALGAGFALLLLKKLKIPVSFSAVMIIAGLTNYIGFSYRAFQTRFMWPLYLAVFFGFGLYHPMRLITKKWKLAYPAIGAICLGVLILLTNPTLSESQGLMDQNRWDAMQWLRHNTPLDSKLYFFYGDLYYQSSMLYNTHRPTVLVQIDALNDALVSQSLNRNMLVTYASDSGAQYPYQKGFFSYGFHLGEDVAPSNTPDLCTMDYFVFDKGTGNSQRAPYVQYSLAIREALLKNSSEEVYSNQIVSIVKNNNKDGECIGA